MPDIWMDVDVALASVPVNLMPLLDATDYKTIEDAVAFDAAGLALFWNFTTTAGVKTVTAVTPTSAGNYDWTDFATSGMYGIEIPASGGASINNDTEGFGYFTGVATGVLPFRGPVIGFRAAALNNALIDGGDLLDVNVTELVGVAQSAIDLKDFADDGYDPSTNKVQGVVLTDTVTTYTGNTPQTGDAFARLGAPAGASVSADIAAIEAQTDDIGVAGAGLTAVPWNTAWDAEVQSEAEDAIVAHRLDELLNADSDIDGAAPPTVGSVFHELMTKTAGSFTYDQTTDSNEAIRDNMGTAQTGDSFARLGAPAGASVSADIAAIEAQTDDIGVAGAGLTAIPIVPANVTQISGDSAAADALESYLDGSEFMPVDAHAQDFSVSGGQLTTKKPDGTTDTAYSPKTVASDPAAEPIVGVS